LLAAPAPIPEEERQQAYEAKWAEGGSISFRYAYTDLLLKKSQTKPRPNSCAGKSVPPRSGLSCSSATAAPPMSTAFDRGTPKLGRG